MASADPPVPSSAPTLGRYRIVRLIARSNDTVYEAFDPAVNRRVAVKELALSPHLSGQQRRERIERFYREAKAAGNLGHPNIVTIHEVGHEGERHYIAMEYLEGPSLRDILRMRGTLPIREALQIGLQLCDALGYAHMHGVVHRDVKPDNIHLVLPNDVVKLTDFGIARVLADPAITSTGQVFGTPSYMSPEQIASRSVDHRTDIFSLGVVLYELVAGKKPFQGDSVITITYNIMNTNAVVPNSIPPGVAALITRALAKDPDQRYSNMAALAADLHAELAFSESPYHRTIPPGSLTADELAAEQTALVDRGDLLKPSANGISATNGATPSNGTAGPSAPDVQAAEPTFVPPPPVRPAPLPAEPVTMAIPSALGRNYLPPAPPQESQLRNTLLLAAGIVLVIAVVLLMVFAVKSALDNNRYQSERTLAQNTYDEGNLAARQGDRRGAIDKYLEAISEAPPDSDIARKANQALREMNSGSSAPAAPPEQSSAATHYNMGLLYERNSNEDAALLEFAAASAADPDGSTGAKARAAAARGYTDQAERAYQAGDLAQARASWQKVIDISPSDPLADQARQQLQDHPADTSPPASAPATSTPATSSNPSSSGAASAPPAPSATAPTNGASPGTPPPASPAPATPGTASSPASPLSSAPLPAPAKPSSP